MSFFIQGAEENGGQPAFEPFEYVNLWGSKFSTPKEVQGYSQLNGKGHGYQGYVDEKGLKQGEGVKIVLSTEPMLKNNVITNLRTEERYEGHFINDRLYGEGTLTVIDVQTKNPLLKYTGNFEEYAKCGRGKLTDYKNKLELEGYFNDDALVQGTRNQYKKYRVKNEKRELYDLMNKSQGEFKNGKLNDLQGILTKYESGEMIERFEGGFDEGLFYRGLRTKYTDGTVKQTDEKVGKSWVRKIYDADGNLKSEYGCPQYVQDLPYGEGYERKYENNEEISLYKGKFFNGLYSDTNAIFATLSDVPDETYVYNGEFRKGVFWSGTKRIVKGDKVVDAHKYVNGDRIFPEAQM